MNYILIDLERTIASGMVHYWKRNRHGYTRDLAEAGRFHEEEAERIVSQDFDRRTIRVDEKVVEKIRKDYTL